MAEEKKVTKAATKKVSEPKKETAKKEPTKKVEAPKAEKAEKAAPKKAVKKEEVKKEAPKKVVTEAKASSLNSKITPRKARLLCDLVRGKSVEEALGLLMNVERDNASRIISKLIKSAAANATNNFNMNSEKLYIAEIMASDSVKMKRYLPRAKGSASGLVKRFANIYCTVKERK